MNIASCRLSVVSAAFGLVACTNLQDIPDVQPIPSTAAAAIRADTGALKLFNKAVGDFMTATGVLTDELSAGPNGLFNNLDKRDLNSDVDENTSLYVSLQNTRVTADVAERSLALLAPSAPSDMRGSMYAVQGYVEIMLADLFCSGVPLSTLNLANAEVVYQSPLPRDSVYLRAVTHFDSATTLAGSNDSLATLSRIGKGRALLALGQFAEAAIAVASVSDNAHYKLSLGLESWGGFENRFVPFVVPFLSDHIADREGSVGLPYASSLDPRTSSIYKPDSLDFPNLVDFPRKYAIADSALTGNPSTTYLAYLLADGTEARLIQAEAALHANDLSTWLQILNHLRATASMLPLALLLPDGPALTLAPLSDPGTPNARVDTMFAERAKWLYLTGHRQGDLRRLMRQYGRTQSQVYPNGTYADGSAYGTSVTVPVPSSEEINPNFHGCLDRLP